MKKLLYLLFVTLSLSVKSQITFDHSPSFTINHFEEFTTSGLGDKYIGWSNDTIVVYNDDWSIYRNVIIPTGYSYSDVLTFTQGGIPSISDNLFNSDTVLEFLGVKNLNYHNYYTVSVINELGQIQYTFPDSINYGNVIIYKISGSYKVMYENPQGILKIYSLPGNLPCSPCTGISGIIEPNQGGGLSGLNVYPNPFNNSLEINYNFLLKQDNPRIIISDILGRELKSIPLVNQSDKITINTTDFPRGTMIVSLFGNSQNPISKKVIKIN